MISATSNWIAANANPKLKPIFVAYIPGYAGFSTAPVSDLIYPSLGIGALVGAFTDSSGEVIQTLPVGRGMTLRVPSGATQLQLGINHDEYFLNAGSFSVSVNGTLVNVPGTAAPWLWVRGGLNNSRIYGLGRSIGTAGPSATTVVAMTGLTVGQVINIHYVNGLVSCFTLGFSFINCGPGGDPTFITRDFASFNSDYPTIWMGNPVFPWLTSIDDISVTVSDLDGGADLSDLSFVVQDNGQAITSVFNDRILEGSTCELYEGYGKFDPQNPHYPVYDSAGVLALSEFLVRFTGRIDVVASENNNQEYRFTVPDVRKDLTKIIYQIADDGFPTDQNHRKTFVDNPINILIDLLENQCGYSAGQIDTATLINYRDTIFAGFNFKFSLDSPPAAKDFIENEILKPLCGYHWTNNLGIIKFTFFYPLSTAAATSLDHSTLMNVPRASQAELINQVTYRFDADADNKLQAESLQNWNASINKFGLFGEHIIESIAMKSSFQGYFLAAFCARLIFLRYGNKQLVIDELGTRWSESRLEPGDIVLLTSNLVPDRSAGTMGVTSKAFEVIDRTWSPLQCAQTLKLLEIDTSKFRQYLITPDAEADFTAATPTDQGKYLFLCDVNDKYSDSTPGNTLC